MLRAFFDLLAKMGLSVRDDPPKVVDPNQYTFGEANEGLALAVKKVTRADPDAAAAVSVVIRNVGQETKAFVVPGWLAFFHLDVRQPDGTPVELTPFGRALSHPSRTQERLRVSLAPGALNETEVPLGAIFRMNSRGTYEVRATCHPFDGVTVESNRIAIG